MLLLYLCRHISVSFTPLFDSADTFIPVIKKVILSLGPYTCFCQYSTPSVSAKNIPDCVSMVLCLSGNVSVDVSTILCLYRHDSGCVSTDSISADMFCYYVFICLITLAILFF